MKQIAFFSVFGLVASLALISVACTPPDHVFQAPEGELPPLVAEEGSAEAGEHGAVAVAFDPEGEKLFNSKTCWTCHGKDGKTPILPEYPLIAGQNAEYALNQMLDIKTGARANGGTAAMKGIIHLVTDEEMKILAEYVATLPAGYAGADAPPVPDGEKLFNSKTCWTCHGKDGKTPILPSYPLLAGQNAEYALQQMLDIKTGARTNGQTAAMKGIIHLVDDDELKILADYIATLEP